MGEATPAEQPTSPDAPSAGTLEVLPPDHPSSMVQRLGWVHRRLSSFAFSRVHVDAKAVERVRRLAADGTLVYVMRTRSVADYLLVRAVLAREGLPLPEFVNDIGIGWFRPMRWIAGRVLERLSRFELFRHAERQRPADRESAAALVGAGRPILVFLRSRSVGLRGALIPEHGDDAARIGAPYLEDLLAPGATKPASIVPLAIFRGRGYRRRSAPLSNFVYSVQEAPGEIKKLLTFLFNREELTLTIGAEIDRTRYLDRYRGDVPRVLARRLMRVLQLFLYREERVVWGPPLVPKSVVREIILDQPEMRKAIERVAEQRHVPIAKARREAKGYFDEMASSFNGGYFAILAFFFLWIWRRIFRGVEITGLDRVADTIRRHPVVLVPCHRSHFDYLILTYIFHGHFLSPPHIAAGINLSFFPMGALFRGAGAYFIRRTFGDNVLYKEVFRQYLAYLIREGYTQEFFIEGGRSRSGKILTPKLGMLGAIVDAFVGGPRSDLYLVPVSISYERLVEEETYKRELLGAEKEKENIGALVKARSVLSTNYGKAYVAFAEPISLGQALGALREQARATPDDPAIDSEVRRFTVKLGFRILEQVNEVSVLSAPSIAATVLLSHPHPAIRVGEFVAAASVLLEHATYERAKATESLLRNAGTFRDVRAFLESNGLVARIEDGESVILHVPDDKRLNLDFYKNNSIHWFVLASLVAHALANGVAREALVEEVGWWLDLFGNEFLLPGREQLASEIEKLLARLGTNGRHPLLRIAGPIVQNFREAYWVAARTLRRLDAAGTSEKTIVAEMQRIYRTHVLLGVLRKPEGNTVITLGNALARFREVKAVRRGAGAGKGDRRVLPGPAHETLAAIEDRLAKSLALASG